MPTPGYRGAPTVFPEGTTLHACGPDGVAELAKRWRIAQATAHTVIIAEGDTDDDVFFVLGGQARAASYTDGGGEVMLSDLGTGEPFGIFAAIDGQPRSSCVIAVEETLMGRISAAEFRAVLFTHPRVNRTFMRYMVDKIRATSGHFTTVARLNTEQRLIVELIRLAVRSGVDGDTAVLDPAPTQQELALLIFAAHREEVGRDLLELEKRSLLERHGDALHIASLDGLRARLDTLASERSAGRGRDGPRE